ncbi:MAG: carotenoid biosynthesis protein [Polyangiaceae bacterium]
MIALELVCAVIVVVYLVLRLRPAVGRTEAVLRYVAVAVAALLSEDSVIRAYGFYFYDRGWHVFLDKVPLLIVCIWPVVIDSAWQVAERIAKRESQPVPWIAALIVLVDASLIEPVAVKSGLWRWTEPGIFRVPPVGILGWALFTFAFVALSAPSPRTGGTDSAPAWKRTLLAVVLAPVATHAMLLLAWWGRSGG